LDQEADLHVLERIWKERSDESGWNSFISTIIKERCLRYNKEGESGLAGMI
jgi:hypothetical protein